jgi:hypothetical protein
MALRIPQNKIKVKYTSGGEYVIANSNIRYQGYYHELNGKVYTGKEYNAFDSRPLTKITPELSSQLLFKPNTALYGAISNTKIPNSRVIGLPLEASNRNPEANVNIVKFYCQQLNTKIIKDIDETTYLSLQNNPLFITTYVGIYNNVYQDINDANQQIINISDWIDSNEFS